MRRRVTFDYTGSSPLWVLASFRAPLTYASQALDLRRECHRRDVNAVKRLRLACDPADRGYYSRDCILAEVILVGARAGERLR